MLYHRAGILLADNRHVPKYTQLYFYDSREALNYCMGTFARGFAVLSPMPFLGLSFFLDVDCKAIPVGVRSYTPFPIPVSIHLLPCAPSEPPVLNRICML
jgi:hypothetical protein